VGIVLFGVYHIIYRELVWHCEEVREWLGLNHITKLITVLQEEFPSYSWSHDEMRAVWDSVLFEVGGPVKDRIMFLF
jgi:hypothetical protein